MFGLDFVGKEIDAHFAARQVRRDVWTDENLAEFSSRAGYATALIFREKEIILFSALQWVAIALAYYLWVQVLGWIPPEVWNSDSKLVNLPLNLAFLAWSLLCVALAAYPIGVLTGAMGAAHFLREQGHESTIAACLRMALPNSHRLWMFHTADGWMTVDIILERLPKKNYFTTMAERAIKEAIYYAWKVGTIGVPPALLAGKGLIEAGKESISLVRDRTMDVLRLRGGYSIFCWVIGVAAYVGSWMFFIRYPELFKSEHRIFAFYFWMGVPILIAVGVINLFVRPIFVIASCQLYSDYLKDNKRSVELGSRPGRGESTFVAFVVTCAIAATIYLYRHEIGLMNVLSVVE